MQYTSIGATRYDRIIGMNGFISIKNIRKDEEIFINYCDEYLDKNVKIPEWI
jgi:hypothetical protein